MKNNKGQFRGFCYIQFSEEDAAQKALQLDRKVRYTDCIGDDVQSNENIITFLQNLEGRPMFVSPNVDKRKQPNFKVKLNVAFLSKIR